MNRFIDFLFFIVITLGGAYGLKKALFHVRNAVLIEVHKGLPPLLPFTEKLTGKKFPF